jgi:hypothetical protein
MEFRKRVVAQAQRAAEHLQTFLRHPPAPGVRDFGDQAVQMQPAQ